ncbi:EmrB/QacA subfamily drug resistance transporter [Cricetibacter osteomyelitidis]|uniref:EmrB/QacA subfamily drug resistance transporter n=1 Tax=Cricetibacter osteomyelitidis TaxID=1521931 RepID=A0A4R2SYW9_9PAST|nr:DHA2 family efflux MFS transporter permease subunit [Cricetibacter osteomyelitidis]TCP94910.1 EmrB/QacA subfamily drug resistance transporter [Cricetibacter osteomyelitidis]
MTETENFKGLSWVAAMAFFMQALDTTILNTALPAIAKSLNESPLGMELAVISYALTLALLIPLSGWLADKYGTRNIFRGAVLLFALGSLFCAMSGSLNMLIASRVLQGVGGALMMPVARLAIIKRVPKKQLINVWNFMAMAGLIGPILGPILGGWLVTYATWHWIFLINLPISIVGILVANRFMPDVKGKITKLDVVGFILFAGGLVALTLGLELIAEQTPKKMTALIISLIGSSLLLAYYLYSKQAKNPLLSLALFRIRSFRVGMLANLLLRLCGSGVPFLLPLMLQVSFHYRADTVGLLMTPVAICSIITKPYIPKILKFFGYKKALIYTALLMSASVALLGGLNVNTPLWLLIMLVAFYGGCMSIMFTSINTLTISDLDDKDASSGSTFLSVIQQVGMSFAIALASVLLGIYRLYIGGSGEQLQQSFSYTFFSSAAIGLLLLWTLTYLRKTDGSSLH